MAWIGQGIAFAGLCMAAAWLEVSERNADGLWFLLVFWAIVTDWYPKK